MGPNRIPMGGKPEIKNPNRILGIWNRKGSRPLGSIWRGLTKLLSLIFYLSGIILNLISYSFIY
jgi:hypothetical protein